MILEAAPGGKHFILKYLSDEIGCKIYATDLVKRKRKLNVVNNLNYTQGDLTKTVYKSNFFDVVYCISVVEHMTEKVRKEYYNEVVRILKPGGKLILSTLEDQKIFGEGPNEAILAGDIYFIPKETFKNIPGLKLEKTGDYLKHPEFNDESIF
jgi:cyclopropane fatty-acyl-phospholipid synthase-like methyltransferase